MDFLDVLDAERTELAAEDRLAQSRTQAATSLVAVYKALGGGWQVFEPAAKSASPTAGHAAVPPAAAGAARALS